MTRRTARVTAFSSQPRVRRRAEATQPGLSLARGSHVGAARSANGCTLGGMRRQITGGCGCGAVRFEVVEPFLSAGYCHCTRCQRRTGTASSANARAVPGSVLVVQGRTSSAAGRRRVVARRSSAPAAARRCSAASRDRASTPASASGRSTGTRASVLGREPSSHTRRPGRRSPTTGSPDSTKPGPDTTRAGRPQ